VAVRFQKIRFVLSRRIFLCVCLGMFYPSVVPVVAQEAVEEEAPVADPKAYTPDPAEKLVALGPGVHKIKKNGNGVVTSLVTVGQARISTTLGRAKGIERARRVAALNADAEFSKWLSSRVSIAETEDSEDILLIENDGGEVPKETGKSVERSSRKMELMSEALVRGLQMIYVDQDPESEFLTVIKGWKADSAEGAKKVATLMAEGQSPSTGSPPLGGGSNTSAAAGSQGKAYSKKSASSDDAKDFLD
jgi:hypothetical protein